VSILPSLARFANMEMASKHRWTSRPASAAVGDIRVVSCKWQWAAALALVIGFTSACTLNPSARKQKYYEDGQNFFAKSQYAAAADEFEKAIKIDPGFAEAHLQLAQSFMLMQQPDRAYREFARTVELRPEDYHARIAMTNLLVMTRNFSEAKEQMDIPLKQRPSDPAVHAADSSLLAEQDDIPGAIREMNETIALAPGRWEPYLSLALLEIKNNDANAAEADFKKVIALDPKEMHPRVLLGRFYQSSNRLPEAEEQYRDAMAIAPGEMEPREALAKLYLTEGKTSDAENTLVQASRDLSADPQSLLALSNFYYTTGDLDKAVATYRTLYQQRPQDLLAKKKYIQLLIQTKHFDEAKTLDSEILKANPSDSDALVYRSEMEISGGNLNDAAQTLQTVVANAPNNSQAHYVLGVALSRQGLPERAESEWREALNLNPDYLDAERALAEAAMEKGDMQSLQDAANQMIRMEPEAPEGYALRALVGINRKQFDAADRDVHRAIDVAPHSAFGYVELGNLKFAQNQFGDAVQAYEDALERNPGSVDALRGLMKSYVAQKQPQKAIAAAQAQIERVPDTSDFYDLLGSGLFHLMNDLNAAEPALEKSVALDGNTDAVIQLCQVQAAKGEIDQAIATAVQALKRSPREDSVATVLGDLYAAKADWKDAQAAYQSAVTINPQNGPADNDLARAMLHTGGNLDVAMTLVQTARRALPDSPSVVDTIGWIYFQRGEYAMAVDSLQQALSLEEARQMPDDPDIHYHLGMAYEKTNQRALAREHFEHVLKTDPNYNGADQIRAALERLRS
jgi:cellulose synthase operon protein C